MAGGDAVSFLGAESNDLIENPMRGSKL